MAKTKTEPSLLEKLVNMPDAEFWQGYSIASVAFSTYSDALRERKRLAEITATEQKEADRLARVEAAQRAANGEIN